MSCDIRVFVEKKNADDWVTYKILTPFNIRPIVDKAGREHDWAQPLAAQQDYERFAALAGVSGSGPEPRGLPDDISQTVRYFAEFWKEDAHSHSYLPLEDAATVFLETEDPYNLTELSRRWPEITFFGVQREADPGEYRVVFWFLG